MKVAIVASPHIPIPPKQYGGSEQVISYLIKGLKEMGHEPILFASGDSEVDCKLIPIVKKALSFPSSTKKLAEFNKKLVAAKRNTTRQLRAIAPTVDIIHSHGYDLKNFKRYPNLTTLHNKVELDELSYYKKRRNLYYVSISKNQQNACPELQYMGVVYNGEDPSMFPIVEKPEDYVCFLGRFDRDKNPHLAIQLAINYGIKIKLGGKVDYHDEGYFDQEIKKYLRHPLVEYLGELGFDEKVELLSRAKCNLHPTGFREPFGLTVLEAAYCGTPTLAIERGAMPELIEQGRTGILVEDFVEGFHQVKECFKMDRSYIANRARLLFNYQVMTKQYLQAYQRVIDIFKIRKQQESAIRDLTKDAKTELESIWQQARQS